MLFFKKFIRTYLNNTPVALREIFSRRKARRGRCSQSATATRSNAAARENCRNHLGYAAGNITEIGSDHWLSVLLWAGLIFFLSDTPDLKSDLALDFHLRKAAHVFEYFILALLLHRAFRGHGTENKKAMTYSIVIAFLYAGSDELHQSFIAGRAGTVSDALIDSLGILLYLLYNCFKYFRLMKG